MKMELWWKNRGDVMEFHPMKRILLAAFSTQKEISNYCGKVYSMDVLH